MTGGADFSTTSLVSATAGEENNVSALDAAMSNAIATRANRFKTASLVLLIAVRPHGKRA
jgi:hypothetical protein